MDIKVVLSADESLTNLIERLISAFTGGAAPAPVVDMPRKKKEKPVNNESVVEEVRTLVEKQMSEEAKEAALKKTTIDDIKALARTASVKNKEGVKKIVKEVFKLENIGDLPEEKFGEFIAEINKLDKKAA